MFLSGNIFKRNDECFARREIMETEVDGIIDCIAEEMHYIWGNWMTWMFKVCNTLVINEKIKTIYIPEDLYKKWTKQKDSMYSELSDEEKETSRRHATKILLQLDKYWRK